MDKRYSRKDICFYGDDAYEKVERFISMYEDLFEKPKGWDGNTMRHFSSYTGSWQLHICVTKENWQKILDSGLLQKHEKGTRGNSLWKVVV